MVKPILTAGSYLDLMRRGGSSLSTNGGALGKLDIRSAGLVSQEGAPLLRWQRP
jgi:hypothetical protein